jgi:hypothetical protein
MPVSIDQIGVGRAFPDPADASRASTGVYHDAVDSAPLAAKLPLAAFPVAPAPQPFASVRRVGGGR